MTPIADLIRRMAAKGLGIEAIASAVEGIEFVEHEKKLERREADRKRKQKQRPHPQETVERLERAETVNALSLVSTTKEDKKESKKEVATRGMTLPPDWLPSEGHYLEGDRLGIPRQRVDQHASDMRIWAEANRNRAVARKADWNATFTGWLRRNSQVSLVAAIPAISPEAAEIHRKDAEITAQRQREKANGKAYTTASSANGCGLEGENNAENLFPESRTLYQN